MHQYVQRRLMPWGHMRSVWGLSWGPLKGLKKRPPIGENILALTDAKIRALKPKEKAYKVSDFGGLYINVTAKGSKLWRLKYRFNGKEGVLSHGPYPYVSLKEARDLRDEAKANLAKGLNPSVAKRQANEKA